MKYFYSLVVTMILLMGSSFAQNGVFAPYVSGSASTTAALDYKNPNFTIGAGVESSTAPLLLDLHGTFNTANSAKTDSGYAGTVTGSAYLKFGKFLAGGGANWATSTGQLASFKTAKGIVTAARESAHPFVGGGVQFKRLRVLVNYDLPGKDALQNEQTVKVGTEFFLAKHVRLTQDTGIVSYFDPHNLSGTRVTGLSVGAGIKLVL